MTRQPESMKYHLDHWLPIWSLLPTGIMVKLIKFILSTHNKSVQTM